MSGDAKVNGPFPQNTLKLLIFKPKIHRLHQLKN